MPKSFDEFYFYTADKKEDIQILNDYFVKYKNPIKVIGFFYIRLNH